MANLDNLRFDSTYARLPEIFYRRVTPTALPAPYLVSFNEKAAELIGLDLKETVKQEFSSILPYDFMCNHYDYGGRYAFNQQPSVGLWNLYKLAQALVPLIEVEAAEVVLGEYQTIFTEKYVSLMRSKLGLQTEEQDNAVLIDDLFEILQTNAIDYTVFFRRLGEFKTNETEKNDLLQKMFVDPHSFDVWAKNYLIRLQNENSIDAGRRERMLKVNPKFVLRNHIAQMVIEEVQKGNCAEVDALLEVLQNPFDEQPEMKRFNTSPPKAGKRVAVNCSL